MTAECASTSRTKSHFCKCFSKGVLYRLRTFAQVQLQPAYSTKVSVSWVIPFQCLEGISKLPASPPLNQLYPNPDLEAPDRRNLSAKRCRSGLRQPGRVLRLFRALQKSWCCDKVIQHFTVANVSPYVSITSFSGCSNFGSRRLSNPPSFFLA